jgi:hypothetical protein
MQVRRIALDDSIIATILDALGIALDSKVSIPPG